MTRMLICLVCFLICVPSVFSAEIMPVTDTAKAKIQLDEILITGTPLKDDPETPNMNVIIPSAILQGIGSTLDGAVKRQPGIDVQRPQEVGAALDDEAIKIRGFGSRRILVTIDGRPLNMPGTAGGYFVDFTTIPLSNVKEIEIIKGVSDPRYGNTLGGAINLVTKKTGKKPETEAQTLGGSYNTWTGNFYHGWKPGNFEYSVSGGYSESDGYLWNGDFWIKNMSLHVGYDFPWNGKIYGDGQYVDLKKGFLVSNRLRKDYDSPLYDTPKNRRYPASDGEIMYGGMGAYAEPGSWWKKERYQYTVGYEQSFSNSSFDVRGWRNYGNREAFNTRRSLGRVFHKEFYDDRSYGTDGTFRYELPYNVIIAGVEAKQLKDDGDKTLSDDFRGITRNKNYVNANIWGAYILDDIKLFEKRLIITPGVRYTSYYGKAGPAGEAEDIKNLSLDGFAPSLKMTYQYQKDAFFYVSGARALRMPTLPEHYWHYSPDAGVYTGNLSFKNEDGVMIQGGWKAAFPTGTKIDISPYYYSIKDFIQFDLINFVSYNIDRAKLYGIEIGLNQRLSISFSFFVNYTYQKTKTKGDPFVANFVAPQDRDFDEIPGLPQHKVNAGIQYVGSGKEKIALFGSFVSSQKVIYNNNDISPTSLRVRKQNAYTVIDLEASYPFMKQFELSAYIRNLLDVNYQERFGYPASEINFGLGLRAWF